MGWVVSNESSGKEERHEIGVISSLGKSHNKSDFFRVASALVLLQWSLVCLERLFHEEFQWCGNLRHCRFLLRHRSWHWNSCSGSDNPYHACNNIERTTISSSVCGRPPIVSLSWKTCFTSGMSCFQSICYFISSKRSPNPFTFWYCCFKINLLKLTIITPVIEESVMVRYMFLWRVIQNPQYIFSF